MRNKRTFRWTCLGLLCGGLLLTGIGVGVQLVEASSLSYGGVQLVEGAPQSSHIVVELGDTTGPISIFSHDGEFSSQLRALGRIEVRDTVTPGTVELDLRYEGANMTPGYWTDDWTDDSGSNGRDICLYWQSRSDLALLLACKDQLLADLKSGRVSDYTCWQLTEAVVSVHPDDAQRVHLGYTRVKQTSGLRDFSQTAGFVFMVSISRERASICCSVSPLVCKTRFSARSGNTSASTEKSSSAII